MVIMEGIMKNMGVVYQLRINDQSGNKGQEMKLTYELIYAVECTVRGRREGKVLLKCWIHLLHAVVHDLLIYCFGYTN